MKPTDRNEALKKLKDNIYSRLEMEFFINKIFDDFEKKQKVYVENQKHTLALVNDILKELESEREIKEYIIKECLNPLKK